MHSKKIAPCYFSNILCSKTGRTFVQSTVRCILNQRKLQATKFEELETN